MRRWWAGDRTPARSRANRFLKPVFLLQRDATGLGARLRGRALRRRDAQHAHRLQPEAEPLAAVGGGDVEAGQLAYALEPVADRVPVREELLGSLGDVAVRLQERLERAHELGVVLLVVGDQGRDRLVVEALQLSGILAHGR